MKIRKSLTNITLAGSLAFGISGCDNNDERYSFHGKIEGEDVSFFEAQFGTLNILNVTRTNGTKVKYRDYIHHSNHFNDTLDYVNITKNGETIRYGNNEIGKEVMKEAQIQYDNYLRRILELKKSEGLSNVKK